MEIYGLYLFIYLGDFFTFSRVDYCAVTFHECFTEI